VKTKNLTFLLVVSTSLLALSSAYLFSAALAQQDSSHITCEVSPQTITYGKYANVSGRLTDALTGQGLRRLINLTYSEDNGTTWKQLKMSWDRLDEWGEEDIWTTDDGYFGPFKWYPECIPHNILIKAFWSGDGLYEASESTVQTLKVNLPPSPPVSILSHNSYAISDTLWVAGEVQNVGTTNLQYVKGTAVYYDVVGKIIGVDIIYTRLHLLAPGEKSPFITFAGISYPEFINASLIANYDLAIRAYSNTTEEPYRNFQINSTDWFDDGDYHVSGELKNTGTVSVDSVDVVATFYSADGTVVDAWDDMADPSTLNPNETASFDVRLWSGRYQATGGVDHYVLQVDCWPLMTSSSISCDVSPSETRFGDTVTVSGFITPAHEMANVTLTYTKPDSTTVTRTVWTDSYGFYNDIFTPDNAGAWTVYASWPGNDNYEGANSSSVAFAVEFLAPVRQVPPPENTAVAIAVGTSVTVGFTAFMTLSGLAQSFNKAISKLPVPDCIKDFLSLYTEKTFETLTSKEIKALKGKKTLTLRELLSLLFSAIVLLTVFVYIEVNGMPNLLNMEYLLTAVPQVLISVVFIFITSQIFSIVSAKALNVWSEFKLWLYGLAALLITGVVFMIPFASPGKVEYQGDLDQKKAGLIATSDVLCILILSIPFYLFHTLGLTMIGDAGLMMSMMTACYSVFPFKPLGGEAIFKYHKGLWTAIFIFSFSMFICTIFSLLPHIAYLLTGTTATLLLIGLILTLRRQKTSKH
jgi:hypothetical protein